MDEQKVLRFHQDEPERAWTVGSGNGAKLKG